MVHQELSAHRVFLVRQELLELQVPQVHLVQKVRAVPQV
jgi:hypothetical protein